MTRLTIDQLIESDLIATWKTGSWGIPMCPSTIEAREELNRRFDAGLLPRDDTQGALRLHRELRGPMVKTPDFESENPGSSPGEAASLVFRLRLNAESIPHDVYSWLNPLLLEAADEIERLLEIEQRFEFDRSCGEDNRFD